MAAFARLASLLCLAAAVAPLLFKRYVFMCIRIVGWNVCVY